MATILLVRSDADTREISANPTRLYPKHLFGLAICIIALLTVPLCLGQSLLPETGKDYVRSCAGTALSKENKTADERFLSAYCMGYLSGYIDGVLSEALTMKAAKMFCIPPKGNMSLYLRVVDSYMSHHPEALQHPMPLLVGQALANGFPCPSPSRRMASSNRKLKEKTDSASSSESSEQGTAAAPER